MAHSHLGHGSTPREGRREKKIEKKKENVTRQVKEKNKGRCLRCLRICMYKYFFSFLWGLVFFLFLVRKYWYSLWPKDTWAFNWSFSPLEFSVVVFGRDLNSIIFYQKRIKNSIHLTCMRRGDPLIPFEVYNIINLKKKKTKKKKLCIICVKEFYIFIQLYASICKTFKIVND